MITPADLVDYAFQEVYSAQLDGRSETVARRVLSACYYALFHELTNTGSLLFDGSDEQRAALARSYDHSALGNAAKEIERRQNPKPDYRLVILAGSLRRSREARERADYDLIATVTWDNADEILDETITAFSLIGQLRSHSEMTGFLLAALVQGRRRG